MPWEIEAASSMYPTIAPFIPVTIENSTCDISSATIGTLFSCVVCVSWTKIQGRYCCLCFVVFTQCDVCQSRNFQHKHNIRREKRKKNDKIDESSKIERMLIAGTKVSVVGKAIGASRRRMCDLGYRNIILEIYWNEWRHMAECVFSPISRFSYSGPASDSWECCNIEAWGPRLQFLCLNHEFWGSCSTYQTSN